MDENAVRLPVVGVMGSGSEAHDALARPLGALIARLGCHLLTGGGQGVMRAVASGFVPVRPRDGLSLGILPGDLETGKCRPPAGYPNDRVELAIRTHLSGRGEAGAGSRNTVNILSADVLVILPGGAGTRSEAQLAVRFSKPAISLGAGYDGLPRAESLEGVEEFLVKTLRKKRQQGCEPS